MEKLINKILKEVNLAEYCTKHYGAKFVNNKSLCIFHKEDKPSLHYYSDSNTLYCFAGCYHDVIRKVKAPKPGSTEVSMNLNIFNVVGLKEGLSCNGQEFLEIVKIICENEGIPFNIAKRTVDPKIQKLLDYKTNLAKEYINNLKSKENEHHMVHAYLRNDRGLTPQTIADFFLGLTHSNESKYGRPYMSNRLAIPILSDSGANVIAISGRHLVGADNGPKYKHDETDEVWKRGEVLYGYSHAAKHAKAKNHLYIVEGFFDMISMYQAGIKNVVATMSNRITEKQIEKIKTLTNNVTFILDQDEAGVDVFTSTLELSLRKGLSVKVVESLGFKGKDMNDLCISLKWNESDIKAFLQANTKDAVQSLLSKIYDRYDATVMAAKYEALRFSNTVLSLIQDPLKRSIYEDYSSKRLNI